MYTPNGLSTAFRTLQRFCDVVLHMVFLHWIFFLFHLHNSFYEEGGDAEGLEARGKVRISQDPAWGIFGAQKEPGLTFLNTRGNRRIGSLVRRGGLWLTNTSCAEYISHPGLADVFSFKTTQAISQLTAKRYTRSGCMKFLLIHRNPQMEAALPALINQQR